MKKVIIEIETANAAFEGDPFEEIKRIIDGQAISKLKAINDRFGSDCMCDAPESIDRLYDINGNTVGRLRIE